MISFSIQHIALKAAWNQKKKYGNTFSRTETFTNDTTFKY